jgi:hypothetical protein
MMHNNSTGALFVGILAAEFLNILIQNQASGFEIISILADFHHN